MVRPELRGLRQVIVTVGSVFVICDGRTLSWTSGMEIDADGSPHAYAPINSGLPALDALANAGRPGAWYGLICDANGVPVIQGSEDPAPGYYVSTTALQDHGFLEQDPRRYVDSETVCYVSLPPQLFRAGARMGDLCEVRNATTGVIAVVADQGPSKSIGEGSIALCKALGVDPFRGKPKHHLLGIGGGVSFSVMLGTASTPPWPRTDLSK